MQQAHRTVPSGKHEPVLVAVVVGGGLVPPPLSPHSVTVSDGGEELEPSGMSEKACPSTVMLA